MTRRLPGRHAATGSRPYELIIYAVLVTRTVEPLIRIITGAFGTLHLRVVVAALALAVFNAATFVRVFRSSLRRHLPLRSRTFVTGEAFYASAVIVVAISLMSAAHPIAMGDTSATAEFLDMVRIQAYLSLALVGMCAPARVWVPTSLAASAVLTVSLALRSNVDYGYAMVWTVWALLSAAGGALCSSLLETTKRLELEALKSETESKPVANLDVDAMIHARARVRAQALTIVMRGEHAMNDLPHTGKLFVLVLGHLAIALTREGVAVPVTITVIGDSAYVHVQARVESGDPSAVHRAPAATFVSQVQALFDSVIAVVDEDGITQIDAKFDMSSMGLMINPGGVAGSSPASGAVPRT